MKIVVRIAVLVIAAALCLPLVAVAADTRVFDYNELFTSSEIYEIQAEIDDMISSYGLDVAVLTTYTADGMRALKYGEKIYERNGLGIGSDCAGVMMVVKMDSNSREYSMVAYGWARTVFKTRRIDAIYDAMFDDMKAGNYADAMMEFLRQVKIELDYQGVTPDYSMPMFGDYYSGNYADRQSSSNTMSVGQAGTIAGSVGVGVSLVATLIMLGVHNRNMKTPSARMYSDSPVALFRSVDRFHSTHTSRTARAENNTHRGGGGRSGGGGYSGGGGSGGSGGGRSF